MGFRLPLKRFIAVIAGIGILSFIPVVSFAESEGVGTEYAWKCDSGQTPVVAVHPTDGEILFYAMKDMGPNATTVGDHQRAGLNIGTRSYRAAEKGVLFSWGGGELKRHQYDFESKKWTNIVVKFPEGSSLNLEAIGAGPQGHLYSIENGWLTHSQFDASSNTWPVWREAVQNVTRLGDISELMVSGFAIYAKTSAGDMYRTEFDPALHRIIRPIYKIGDHWNVQVSLSSAGADTVIYNTLNSNELQYRRYDPRKGWGKLSTVAGSWYNLRPQIFQGICATDVKSAEVPNKKLDPSRVGVVGSARKSVLDVAHVLGGYSAVTSFGHVASTDGASLVMEGDTLPVGAKDSTPALVRLSDDRVQIVLRSSDGKFASVTQKSVGGSYGPAADLGGGFVTPPVAVQNGKIQYLFGADQQGRIWGGVNSDRDSFVTAAWAHIAPDVKIAEGTTLQAAVFGLDSAVVIAQTAEGLKEIVINGTEITKTKVTSLPGVGVPLRETPQIVGMHTGFHELVATGIDGSVFVLHRPAGGKWEDSWTRVSRLPEVTGNATLVIDPNGSKAFIIARTGKDSTMELAAVEENYFKPGTFKIVISEIKGDLPYDPSPFISRKTGGSIFGVVLIRGTEVLFTQITRGGVVIAAHDDQSSEVSDAVFEEVGASVVPELAGSAK